MFFEIHADVMSAASQLGNMQDRKTKLNSKILALSEQCGQIAKTLALIWVALH